MSNPREALDELVAVITEAMGTGGWVPTPLHTSFIAAMAAARAALEAPQVSAERLHADVCEAVSILNTAPDLVRIREGRQVSELLRQALIDYADEVKRLAEKYADDPHNGQCRTALHAAIDLAPQAAPVARIHRYQDAGEQVCAVLTDAGKLLPTGTALYAAREQKR